MDNLLNFKVGKDEFLVAELIDKKIDYTEVQRFIQTVRANDDKYIVHDPMPEDIIISNDNWSCHDAEKIGLIFEFVGSQLFYIGLKIEADEDFKTIKEECSEQICWKLIDDEYYGKWIVYYSERMYDLKIIPNRFSIFIESIMDGKF